MKNENIWFTTQQLISVGCLKIYEEIFMVSNYGKLRKYAKRKNLKNMGN